MKIEKSDIKYAPEIRSLGDGRFRFELALADKTRIVKDLTSDQVIELVFGVKAD